MNFVELVEPIKARLGHCTVAKGAKAGLRSGRRPGKAVSQRFSKYGGLPFFRAIALIKPLRFQDERGTRSASFRDS
ncbi:hypothetical protein DESC_40101 [Desulfosarcina cetonica]|nr:hypothetical protein DESC_40101 [Desulfosarcina cetonica]